MHLTWDNHVGQERQVTGGVSQPVEPVLKVHLGGARELVSIVKRAAKVIQELLIAASHLEIEAN